MPLKSCIVFFFTLFISAAHAQVIVPNNGFESVRSSHLPEGWTVQSTLTDGEKPVECDQQIRYQGANSLHIHHPVAAQTEIQSTAVSLEVGQLYSLTAWIKTEKASADPGARYPTAVAACMRMASLPFTEHSETVAASQEWQQIKLIFFATQVKDRVCLHLGYNGTASGDAWFDEVNLEKLQEIEALIPFQTVAWYGPAFRYTDKGWTFVHIEGEPYQRGFQYGYLLARDITTFMDKLALRPDAANPQQAWSQKRQLTDALMLRSYDEEYLVEMRGICDGVNKAGATWSGHKLDLLDIVTINSDVDLGQLGSALNETAHSLTGRSFNAEQQEMNALEKLHKCSSFLASGPATSDGKIVFGQLFMWGGYTGVHWNIICDVQPSRGHRLVYETFPGGIHSGADFYINQAGIMIGETTVMQTPFDINGTPQSNRIRKAAQYANSIDDVAKILGERNNGLYTNDWLIADTKTNEIAILLLGTKKAKLWRSSKKEFPGETDGFLWSVNNAKDPDVRREYIPDPQNAPFDVVYSNSNRDLAFFKWYQAEKGHIDGVSAARFLAGSPINRPHACDGKVTTSAMAKQMMFWAHHGKVTLRAKFPETGSRIMPDLANAIPHLALGYSAINPVYMVEKMQARRKLVPDQEQTTRREPDLQQVSERYQFDKKLLWSNTVLPATEADNWFVSASAAYWNMLSNLPDNTKSAMPNLCDQLQDMNCRLLFNISREGAIAPSQVRRRYDRYKDYLSPRIRGTFLLHQLRLLLGNERFSKLMNAVHDRYHDQPMNTAQFLLQAKEVTGQDLDSFISPWLNREDMPALNFTSTAAEKDSSWNVHVDFAEAHAPYDLLFTIAIETEKETIWQPIHLQQLQRQFTFTIPAKPKRLVVNVGNDVPLVRKNYYVFSNLFDEFDKIGIVYGTSRQIEANHSLALRYQNILADVFTETILPLYQDAEVPMQAQTPLHSLVLGGPADNRLTEQLCRQLGIQAGLDYFSWRDKSYTHADDGLFLAMPHPEDEHRILFLFIANSDLQLWNMTKKFQSMPSWAIFKGDQIVEKGFHIDPHYEYDYH
jgi:hypothetical protein